MRMYYSEENDPVAYSQLKGLITNDQLWRPASEVESLAIGGGNESRPPTFLEIIGKEYDELSFSNLLAYYFEFDHMGFAELARDENLLGVTDMETDFEIVRESNFNVDLWIESENNVLVIENNVLVIENKIKSGINGLDDKGNSQLDKYRKHAEGYAAKHGKKLHCFVFLPDYSGIDLPAFDPEGFYKVVHYSKLFEFFVRETPRYITSRYFPEFLRGLERQTLPSSELNFRIMRSRFMRKIAQAG